MQDLREVLEKNLSSISQQLYDSNKIASGLDEDNAEDEETSQDIDEEDGRK